MSAETWKPIKGWEGLYEVSDLGRVRSFQRAKQGQPPAVLESHPNRNGYIRVRLFRNGQRQYGSVHRLVCQAFRGEALPGMQVNHIDGNKANNRLDNLEYATPRENNLHALYQLGKLETLPRGEANKAAKLTEADVIQLRELWASGNVRRRELAEMFSISETSIRRIVSGQGWKHVGGAK
jgi:hypothetical protein